MSRKSTRSSYNESMSNGAPSQSSYNETTPKVKKRFGININAKFDIWMKTRCELTLKFIPKLFFTLGVVSLSEDDEEVPLLSPYL